MVSASALVVRHYTFVDYATQAYSLVTGLLILCLHNETVPCWPWLLASHVVCLGLVHLLIVRHARARPSRAVDLLRHFYPMLLYLWFFAETGWLNRMVFPEFMDPLAIRWDQALFGFQPSITFMLRFPYLPLSEVFYAAYFSYYPMIVGIGLALFLRDRRQFFHYISVLSFVFYVCYLIYILVPIIGPRVFLEDVGGYHLPEASRALAPDPAYPPVIQTGVLFKLMNLVYRVFEAPGSAIPSSHVALALCTLYFSFRYLPRIRFPHLAVVLLLCLATIYCRFHYVVDVLAGVAAAGVLLPLGNLLYWKSGGAGAPGRADPLPAEVGTTSR